MQQRAGAATVTTYKALYMYMCYCSVPRRSFAQACAACGLTASSHSHYLVTAMWHQPDERATSGESAVVAESPVLRLGHTSPAAHSSSAIRREPRPCSHLSIVNSQRIANIAEDGKDTRPVVGCIQHLVICMVSCDAWIARGYRRFFASCDHTGCRRQQASPHTAPALTHETMGTPRSTQEACLYRIDVDEKKTEFPSETASIRCGSLGWRSACGAACCPT